MTNLINYDGFDVVKNLSLTFPEIYFYIQGGSAGYLHVLNEKNVEIELNDVDIVVICKNDTVENINNKIINYIKSNYKNVVTNNNCDPIYYVKINHNVNLNFFVNEITEIPNDIIQINGINVRVLSSVINEEKNMLDNLVEDLNYCLNNNCGTEEIKYFESKIKRKQDFFKYF